MAKPDPAEQILRMPRVARGIQSEKDPEVVAFYNHFRRALKRSPWKTYQPFPLGGQYGSWALLHQTCRSQGIDPIAYCDWILTNGTLSHPAGFLKFAMASGTFWRFQQREKAPAPRHRTFGKKLVDDRTGEPVSWIFNQQGEPLLSPPPSGEVYDAQGNPIPLRRFS